MKKGKSIWLRLSAGILILALLSGCSNSKNILYNSETQDDQKEEISLTFFGFKYEALNVMAIEDALRGYMDAHPNVSISYEGIKGRDYFDVLMKRMSSGNGDDIFMVDHSTLLELLERGYLADLSDLSSPDNFNQLVKSQMLAREKTDYIPTSISAFGLYCNLDLLKKHGQKIPENWNEFRQVCDYFTGKGITPVVANNDISLKTIAIAKGMYPVYHSENPAEEFARFNRGEKDLAETLRPGFELVEQMLQRGYIDPQETLHTEKTKDDLVLFAKGEQPFMLTGAWATPRLRELNPDFSFAVYPYPVLEDGSVLVVNVDTRVCVNADSPHLEEAKQFVGYLTQKDVMWEFVDSQSSFSPLDENRLSDEVAVQPIGPYLSNGYSVLGADDNLHYPIWDLTRQCVVKMLEGGNAEDAVSLLEEQIISLKEGGTS